MNPRTKQRKGVDPSIYEPLSEYELRLRDQYAGIAMGVLMAEKDAPDPDQVPGIAFMYADLMLVGRHEMRFPVSRPNWRDITEDDE